MNESKRVYISIWQNFYILIHHNDIEFCCGGGSDFSWITLTGFITSGGGPGRRRGRKEGRGWFLLYWFQNSSVLLWDWQEVTDELEEESENEFEEDFDLKSRKGKEPSLLISLDPKEKELLLGKDCLSKDSTKLCLGLLSPACWGPRLLSTMDLDLARLMLPEARLTELTVTT